MSQRFMNFGGLLTGTVIIDAAGEVRIKNTPVSAISHAEQQRGELGLPFDDAESVCVDVEETLKGLMTSILMNASATMPATIDPKYLIDATQFMQQIGEL